MALATCQVSSRQRCRDKLISLHGTTGRKVKVKLLGHVRRFATPWTVAYQALPSMGFSTPGYWTGLPFPSPGDLPNPGIEPGSPALQTDTLPSEPPGKPSVKHGAKDST